MTTEVMQHYIHHTHTPSSQPDGVTQHNTLVLPLGS